jgi:PilZ domain
MKTEKPPAAEVEKHDERRRAQRHRTLKAAKLVSMEGWSATDGVVRDQSETGARISVGKPESVPDEFRLVVVKEATIQPCTVRWRASEQMGVEYSGEAKPAPPRKL